MNYSKIDGPTYAVNSSTLVVRDEPTVKGDTTITRSGFAVPAADVHARRIAREAEAWLAFALDRTRMRPDTLVRKSLDSAAYSVARRASSFCVPSKLVSLEQRQLWSMLREHAASWSELTVDTSGDGLAVLYDGEPVGMLQTKHEPWIRPLLPFGARLYLARVTGHEREGYRLGCNVVVGHVGQALDALSDALGGLSSLALSRLDVQVRTGDGAAERGSEAPVLAPSGDGSASPLRLVVLPAREARTPDADDVVLWRTMEGQARASVPHAVRHSPSGIEWGYAGSGPADLARSVLLALAGEQTAGQLYQAFKAEVVASVPYAGGVIRAADVRTWIAAQLATHPAA